MAVVGGSLLAPDPAAAHGVGGRADLPIEPWLFAYAAGAALAVSFVLLGMLWTTPRLERAAAGRPLPAVVADRAGGIRRLLRAIGLLSVVTFAVLAIADPGWSNWDPVPVWFYVVFWAVLPVLAYLAGDRLPVRLAALASVLLVVAASLFGSASSATNPGPVWFYVVFWVGVPAAAFVLGDIWRVASPFDTVAALGQRIRRWRGRATPPVARSDEAGVLWTNWPGLVAIGGFLWLELAYHSPDSPRVVGWAIVVYTLGVAVVASRLGRAWLQVGEGFTVLFGLIAAMAPIAWNGGRVRLRMPFAGLATLPRRRGQIGIVLVTLGGTTFDGVTRTSFWNDVIEGASGWELTAYNTVGLVWVVGLVTVAWLAACRIAARLSGRDPRDPVETVRYLAALVPIVLAYSVAHYFSLLWFETQNAVAKMSDPFARGWDVFGTIDIRPDYAALSTDLIAYVQVGAIVVGHIAGVTMAHDRAVAELPRTTAVRSQYPFLAVMIGYTVAGLLLLLNA